MPARKSNASVMSTEDQGLSVEDLNLPKTMVNRLAKGALPANTNLQSIAQAAISKSATVFVNYLTSHASDVAARQNKKTIQPKDVLEALKEIEFEQFTERVDRELQRYNTIQCDKRNTYRRKVKEEKRAAEAAANGDPMPPPSSATEATAAAAGDVTAPQLHQPGAPNGAAPHAPPHHTHDGEPVAKRARRDSEDNEGGGEGDDTLGDEQEQDEEDEGEDEGDEEGEDEGDEDEDENEGEDGEREDLLEEKEEREEQDEALDEGEESD